MVLGIVVSDRVVVASSINRVRSSWNSGCVFVVAAVASNQNAIKNRGCGCAIDAKSSDRVTIEIMVETALSSQ
jgi:hypothetical protein